MSTRQAVLGAIACCAVVAIPMTARAGLIRLQVGAGDPYCSLRIQPFMPVNIYATYDPDSGDPMGPDGITGAEFRIDGLQGTFFSLDNANPARTRDPGTDGTTAGGAARTESISCKCAGETSPNPLA